MMDWNRLLLGTIASAGIGLSASAAMAQAAPSLNPAGVPIPTPVMQAIIDKDISRHFGDSPAEPGPLATDLSRAMTPAAVNAAVKKVADWQLARAQPYFDRIWTWSVLYVGFIAASDTTGDPRYRDAMITMSNNFDWALHGRLPNADDQSIGQAYVDLYFPAPNAAHLTPTRTALDSVIGLDTLTPTDTRIPWWWCDALFMAPPLWARMGTATHDPKYVAYLNKQWHRTYDLLYDKEEHLYARDATYISQRGPNGKKIFWSRGEGWVMGGLARTLEYLPKDDPNREFYITQLREMSTRVAELQGPDGQWHAGLLDPEYYTEAEVSGAALMTYGMAWGINHGVLDRKQFAPVVEKAWRGMLGHIYADGRLGDIQQTGAEPAFYLPSASYTYGVGGFLLAGHEVKEMVSHKTVTKAHAATHRAGK